MPLLAGTYLSDASGNQVQDASTNDVGEPGVVVNVTYGGFLVARNEGDAWTLLDEFLEKIRDAIDLGEGFVTQAVLANITNGIAMLLANQKRLTWTGSNATATYEGEENWTGHTVKGVLDAITGIEPGGGLTTEEHDKLMDVPSATIVANQVWEWPIQGIHEDGVQRDSTAGLWQVAAGQRAVWDPSHGGIPLAGSRWWGVWGAWTHIPLVQMAFLTDPTDYYLPADPDFSNVEAGDTLLSFLQREYPTITWVAIPVPNLVDAHRLGFLCTGAGFSVWIGPTFTLPELQASHADVAISEGFLADTNTPPVWPGIDGVTLGTPVALSEGLTITTPMDGVLIAISAVDQYKTWFTYHNIKAYRHVGSLAFFSDNGELEEYQLVAFEEGVYTCRYMKRAAGVKIRTAGGTVGTVTPWLISEP